jgi:hypothetical protein
VAQKKKQGKSKGDKGSDQQLGEGVSEQRQQQAGDKDAPSLPEEDLNLLRLQPGSHSVKAAAEETDPVPSALRPDVMRLQEKKRGKIAYS